MAVRRFQFDINRVLLGLLLLAAACGGSSGLMPAPPPDNPHEAYAQSLRESRLADSALGRDWLQAASACLEHALPIEAPFQETFFADPTRAFAIAYRFPVRRGQRAEISVESDSSRRARLFVDLFRASEGPVTNWDRVASADPERSTLTYEPRRDGHFVVRIQPELLRGGNTRIEIRNVAMLTFPVERRSPADIGSRFGAPRDGGRRAHHGVDIFAPRHTPVVAAGPGSVRRVGTNRLGGQIIWLYDEKRRLNFYYAHLQSQSVKRGDRVQAGQVIGTVGNSGNARTTPPHLHFGIYARGEGPIDPDHFLRQPRQTPPDVAVDTGLVGDWGRTLVATRLLGPDGSPVGFVPPETPVRMLAGREGSFRVALPDGTTGYLRGSEVESAVGAIVSNAAVETLTLWPRPAFGGHPLARVEPGARLETLGFSGGFQMVRTQSGTVGWHPLPEAAAAGE